MNALHLQRTNPNQPAIEEAPLGSVRRILLACVFCALACVIAAAQETPKLSLDTSPTLFNVLAGINACGFDQDLANSSPIRAQVRKEMSQQARTPAAQDALGRMCRFYIDHQAQDNSRQLAQYISLALNLGEPPAFQLTTKEADMPPDANFVLGFVPLLRTFHQTDGMEKIWSRHRVEYDAMVEKFHKPVSEMLLATDVYLKQPISGYVGRSFTVYVEPMAPAGIVNARQYADSYYMVVSPVETASGPSLKLDQIRHTYLHYVLDPMTQKRANTMKRLRPLLDSVVNAPLEDTYKHDVELLLTESLIRAVEARLAGPKASDAKRQSMVEDDMREGFILTRYFYETLIDFEKTPVGLRDAYGNWLVGIDVSREAKRAAALQFSTSAAPEVVRGRQQSLPDAAERQLAAGNLDLAQKLAQQALDDKDGDPGRALFVLARAATLRGNIESARNYFDRTLRSTQDAHVLAWAHIYLGRIADLQEDRQVALEHYRAALDAEDAAPETKAAAERGLQEPYQPAPKPKTK